MPNLWISTGDGEYGVLVLENASQELPASRWPFAADAPPAATLIRVDASDTWALIARDERVRVNGVAVPGGLAILDDRDEIVVPGAPPFFFSTERLARIEPAPSRPGRPIVCPRCHLLIDAGSPAVSCPNCFAVHHESDELPCFTIDAAPCGACGQLFELNGNYRFAPDGL